MSFASEGDLSRFRGVFAGGLTFTDPAHQRALEELRGERKRRRREPEVETRPWPATTA